MMARCGLHATFRHFNFPIINIAIKPARLALLQCGAVNLDTAQAWMPMAMELLASHIGEGGKFF
jgi:hypothetical protein